MMGFIGGTQWHTKEAFPVVIQQLQTPTVAVTNAALTGASTFRTGLSTQLSPIVAMAIHAIRWNFFVKAKLGYEDLSDAILGILTEDVGATIAADELTDPRTLAEAGVGHRGTLETAVGGNDTLAPLLWTAEFDPPILSIAQNLRIVGQIVEAAATTAPDTDIHAKLYYTVKPIDERVSSQLIQRLNLAVQP